MGGCVAPRALLLVAACFAAFAVSAVNGQTNQTLQSNLTTALSQNQTAFAALVSSLQTALQARLSSVNLTSLNTTQTPPLLQTSLNLSQPIIASAAVNLTLISGSNNTLFVAPSANPFNVTNSLNQTVTLVLTFSPLLNSSANATNASIPTNQTLSVNGTLVLGCQLTLPNRTATNASRSTPLFALNGSLTVNSTQSSNGTLLLIGTLVFGNATAQLGARAPAPGAFGPFAPASAPLPQTQQLAPVGAPPGQFSNPVMFAEFADPDVIRVQNDFYMAVTSFHMFPGAHIMHSRDLINWEYLSHAIPQLPPSIDAKCYNLDGCDKYGTGTWANSLRFYNNTFYLMTNMNDNGALLSRAADPAGPWSVTALGWACQDPGLFFDDDNSIYAVCGHGQLNVYTLSPDFQPIGSPVQIVNDSVQYPGFASRFYGIEGSHMYKSNGTYYIYALWGGGEGQQMALRATNPTGPYEYYKVLQGLGEDNLGYKENSIHQGCLVNTTNGEWWSYLLQDHDAVGRLPIIQQVKFVDGWPTIGDGKAQQTVPYPSGIYSPDIFPATSDEFNRTTLGMQWQWNHQPDNTKWSLTERPGYLTLHTATAIANGNLTMVRNQLTQRVWGPQSVATVALDVSGLVDGDVAGLSIFQVEYAYIGVRKTGTSLTITQVENAVPPVTAPLPASATTVYLQATFTEGSQQASFAYSTDGQTFTPLGPSWKTEYRVRVYVGFRFGLFIFNTAGSLQGSANYDYIRVSVAPRNSS
ncbi:glycoside hydrolase family 43 [Klebsormidium nitens]|uniref:Glycoside hydrolase family 43 n=1 Tax=Klebsormidium nitens TaxID=105231 RepID=A0A1Y1INY9_KLENI|nr:glycoside hydrolase family 43 [Klebsormidium nitens]|eukprot:GAQ90496.1 glycoside hydrolase family 43 [Klebsormidium nitens]